MSVPRLLHSAWIGPRPIPDRDKRWTEQMERINPTWKYRCHGNELLQRYADDPYVRALVGGKEKWAFVMDRLRVLLLRDEGGVWLDADCQPLRPLDSLPIWDLAHVQFATGMRSPHRREVALYRGVALVDNHFLASAPNSHMVRRLLSLWTPEAPVVTGHRCGIAIMENLDHTTCIVNHRYFHAEQVYPESIVLHDTHNLGSWLSPDHATLKK